MFDLPSHKAIVRCIVDDKAVKGIGEIQLIRDEQTREDTGVEVEN